MSERQESQAANHLVRGILCRQAKVIAEVYQVPVEKRRIGGNADRVLNHTGRVRMEFDGDRPSGVVDKAVDGWDETHSRIYANDVDLGHSRLNLLDTCACAEQVRGQVELREITAVAS